MNIFNVLNLIGGLSLFLFGMSVMGDALERRAGNSLKALLGKLTSGRFMGLLTGLVVTSIIQSSSATTVMVVGFVNSGLMTLKQSIYVIMGANIGTTVTAWILSLAGINGESLFIELLKPSSFTPVLALIGIIFMMTAKNDRKKDTGMILLGFAVLMYGMSAMSGAVSGLKDVPGFAELFVVFKNPILGVIVGALLTAVIQSSSASVGILQALAVTGQVSYGAAIPIIMGQNIGTCVTALLSSIGTNKNARRAALVHLSFNIIGTSVCLIVFCIIKMLCAPVFLDEAAGMAGIAICHSIFNITCTVLLFPCGGLLERIVCHIVPDTADKDDSVVLLDERLLTAPALALERCRILLDDMAKCSMASLNESIEALDTCTVQLSDAIRANESKTDKYEDVISSYLVKLSTRQINDTDSLTASKYLKLIGDFERIADLSLNILESAEERKIKEISFSPDAKKELGILTSAVSEIMYLAYMGFTEDDRESASRIEPLEEVVDQLKEELRTRHIFRMQHGNCSIDAGFVLSDILTNLERISDHCTNIAECLLDNTKLGLSPHETQRELVSDNEDFRQRFKEYSSKYSLPALV
ncbi:MAG: Na/Pi cotransporter family protein [Eubacteriales bacterium]|nr:Na/Pi cotransporter family protein [Eubacteriales bacterium]